MIESPMLFRWGGLVFLFLLTITLSPPASAEMELSTGWLEDWLEKQSAQQPSCKNDCVCEGKTPAQVLEFYNNWKGEREKMTDACALTCWYQYKGMGISSKDAMESCVPDMNRACTRCKTALTPAKATATRTPRSLPSLTPPRTPTRTPTRSLASPTSPYPASISGRLTTTYTLPGKSDTRIVPLSYAQVTIFLLDKQIVGYADENGRYQFTNLDQQLRGVNQQGLTTGALLQVDLRGINPLKLNTPNFEFYYQNMNIPISVRTACPPGQPGIAMECNLDLTRSTLQDTGGVPRERLIPIGLMYFFATRADHLAKRLEPNPSMLPAILRVFYQNPDQKLAWWQAGQASGGRVVGNIYVSEKRFRTISSFNPLSYTIPHEFGHQLMADHFDDQIPKNPSDLNHGGYCVNPSSTDAWVEGFATFFAGMVKKEYYGKKDYWRLPLGNTYINLETNYPAWRWEEIAAAGILLDLVDSAADYSNQVDDDAVAMSLEDLWKALIKPVNYYSIKNMVDLYRGLQQSGIGQEDKNKNGQTDLDDIFIAHGFYERLDNNPAYNPGEKIGFTSHRGVTECVGLKSNYTEGAERRSPPDLVGGYIDLKLQNIIPGAAAGDAVISVEIVYEPPNQVHNFEYEISTQEIEDNRLYLVLPPPEYPAKAVIRVKSGGVFGLQAIQISAQEFWTHISRGVDRPIMQSQVDLVPVPLLAGVSGTILCCGGGALIMVGILIFSRRRKKMNG
ncbi:MAG TPA: hypothetical protein VIO61_02555 [Anaerolineaceae bacterium]